MPGQPVLRPVQTCTSELVYGNYCGARAHVTSVRTEMADSEFDARAMASAILAKVRAAHLVEADARAQLPDTERVRFRDEDRSIRSVEATLLTADDWAKLEKSGSLPNSAVLSDRSVDVKGEHGKVRFRDLAVLIAQACEVYDYYGQSAVRFERAAATMQIVLDFMHFMLPATRQVPPTPGASTRKKLAEIKGRKLAEIVHTYLKAYKSDRPHQGDGALDSAAAAGADSTAVQACDENGASQVFDKACLLMQSKLEAGLHSTNPAGAAQLKQKEQLSAAVSKVTEAAEGSSTDTDFSVGLRRLRGRPCRAAGKSVATTKMAGT